MSTSSTPQRLSEDDFGLKLYNKFPAQYQIDDVGQKLALKRFMQTAGDGGFKFIIQDANGILDIINPSTTEVDVLYALYEQYGLEMFNGIPEEYMRALLPYLGISWKNKGSLDVLEYVTSTLSGIKTETSITYVDDSEATLGTALLGYAILGDVDTYAYPIVTVKLEMDFAISDYFPDSEQFHRILENFVPFYCQLLLVYSYIYYENGSLAKKEEFLDNIVDTKTESRSLKSSDPETYNIKNVVNETGDMHSTQDSAVFAIGATFGDMLFGFIPNEYNIVDTKEESGKANVVEKAIDQLVNIIDEVGSYNTTESLADYLVIKDTDTQGVEHQMETALLGVSVLNDYRLGMLPFEDIIFTTFSDIQEVNNSDDCSSVIGTMTERNCTMKFAEFNMAVLGDDSYEYTSVPY